MSLPTRGAWIEIIENAKIISFFLRRSPHGENGLKPPKTAVLSRLKSVPVLSETDSQVPSSLLIPILPTVSPRAATTKLRCLNVIFRVTKTSIVSETVSYICFFTNPSLFTAILFSTPTIDREPKKISCRKS